MPLFRSRKNAGVIPSLTSDLFDNGFFSPGLMNFDNSFWNTSMRIPPVNIKETWSDFKLDLFAPGMTGEDFKLDIEDDTMTISCERKNELKKERESYKRREFAFCTFVRSFQLPQNVSSDKIIARYEDGILKIVIPKKEIKTTRAKKEIKVEQKYIEKL